MNSTRETLIKAGLDHLAKDGLHGLTLREIARAAGVSHGTPARHFDSLAAMLAAVAAQSFVDLRTEIARAVEAADASPLVQLTTAGTAYVQYAVANPNAYGLMFRPELLDVTQMDYARESAASFQQLLDLTERAQGVGWRSEVDLLTLTALLWASVHGIAELTVQGAMHAHSDPSSLLDVFFGEFAGLTQGTQQ